MNLYYYKAKVARIVDGDTVDFYVDLGFETLVKTRFRLKGIDAPEVRGPEKEAGKAAAKWLQEKLLEHNNEVLLYTYDGKKGKYGRWLCDILIPSLATPELMVNLNEQMVAAGHAVFKDY